nr:PREDICTED: uncharacterized protein LOC105674777 [Linepithema humile]
MIEFLVLFLGVYGVTGGVYGVQVTPHTPYMNDDLRLTNDDNDTEVVEGQLPGTENLYEKELPFSRFFAVFNLAERSQVPHRLPGTGNLSEKRIPDFVLKKLSPADIK